MISHAITCTGPFAILIMLGIKRVENRCDRPAPEKGRCAVSCSKSFCKEKYGEFVRWASCALSAEDFARLPAWVDVCDWPGKIVGCCDYAVRGRNDLVLDGGSVRRDETGAECQTPRTSFLWDEGLAYCWELSEVVCFESPIPCRGALDFWPLAPDVVARVNAADRLASCVGAKIASAEDAARVFRDAVPIAGQNEGFFVLPLDSDRRILSAPILVSLGDAVTAVVTPGAAFSAALREEAASIVVAHNHPSGDPTPSRQDRELTAALKTLGESLGVPCLDHLVLGGKGFSTVSGKEIS